MKAYLYFLFLFLILSCSDSADRITLVDRGNSLYSIYLPSGSDSLTRSAAREMQHYLARISGYSLPLSAERTKDVRYICIGMESLADSVLKLRIGALKEDGFLILNTRDNLVIAGATGKATLFGVYTFLEEYLGCLRFAHGEEHIPSLQKIMLPLIDREYNPDFSFRQPMLYDRNDRVLINWHRVENRDDWGMFVHTFQHLVPPDRYFPEHPEYFSLVNGRRIKDGQLCLSNPRLMQLLKDNLRIRIAEEADKLYWSVSQNDCINYCECKECRELYEKYGAISGAYLHMANEIAREFPDKQISTLAYQFTRSAPVNITPRPNVNIMFCSIECNRSMPFAEDPRSADFVKDMKGWSSLTDNIFMWDYVVQFENYLCPFPNFHTLQPNIRFFKEHNVDMLFEQGTGASWSDMKELKFYLLSRLSWDVNANVDSLTRRFMDLYYREASEPVYRYFRLIHQRLIEKQEEQFLDIYGFPVYYTSSFLAPEHVLEYRELMDLAEKMVGEDSILLKRVWRARLPVDFAYLDLALNYKNPLFSCIREKEGSRQTEESVLADLDRMALIANRSGVRYVNEKGLTVEAYRDYFLRNLGWMTHDNLARKADISVLTDYSEKYPVGGGKALTDGVMGGLNFGFNWLGFEGEDLVVLFDFHQPLSIDKVSMNFLKALVSWVFLPQEIRVETSTDGKSFRTAGKIHPDVTDRNFRVESFPFSFDLTGRDTRYLKITARSLQTCPDWHRGYGQPCWIFIDEIIVE